MRHIPATNAPKPWARWASTSAYTMFYISNESVLTAPYSQHLNTHSKPYPCDKCDCTFALRADLNRHVLARHRVGQKRYPCIVGGCAFKATRKDNVRQHLRKSHPDHPLAPAAARRGKRPPSSIPKGDLVHRVQPPIYTSSTLMQAASTGNIGLLEVLLQLGAELSMKADDGSTALHCAAKASQISMIEFLLMRGAPIEALNQKGWSPLQEAVLNRDRAAARLLLQNHASISQKVLEDVIKFGLAAILQDALDVGGQLLFENMGRFMFKKASEMEQVAILRTLLQSPLYNDQWMTTYQTTVVLNALIHGRSATFKTLLECDKLDPNMRIGRKSLLHIAAVQGQAAILKMLLQCRGCEVNVADGHGRTPLHKAVVQGKVDCVKALLEYPQVDLNGYGPFFL